MQIGSTTPTLFYPDLYGIATWDESAYGRVYAHIVNSMTFREITGMEPPPTPVTARTYQEDGLPWFELYDECSSNITGAGVFSDVRSVKEIDTEKEFTPQQDDSPPGISEEQVIKLKSDSSLIDDRES